MDTTNTLENLRTAILWIEQHRLLNGKRPPRGAIFTEAGLSRSHADQIVNRRVQTVELDTVLRVAERWNVRIAFAILGIDPPEPFEARELPERPKDRYPSRGPVIEMAKRNGYPPAAIDFIATMAFQSNKSDEDEDPGPDYWIDQLRAETGKIARGLPPGPVGTIAGAKEEEATRPRIPPPKMLHAAETTKPRKQAKGKR